ncbi:MAG: hypothetical protein VX976_00065 [Pseudomonadota bacterium]|nr:hypothetical protein [Pseudomonadota bacterium]
MNDVNETTAKTLSKNKIKKFSNKSFLAEKNSGNLVLMDPRDINIEKPSRGWYDLTSLNLRYIDSDLYKKYCPTDIKKKDLFKIFSTTRSLAIGFLEFEGCKKNVNEILPEYLKKKFTTKKSIHKFFFDYFLKNFQVKKKDTKKICEKFPEIKAEEVIDILNNFQNQEIFYIKVRKFIFSLSLDDDVESGQTENDSEIERTLDKKKKNKKIEFSKKLSGKEKEQNCNEEKNSIRKDSSSSERKGYKVFTKKFDVFTRAEKLLKYNELKELRKRFDDECKDNTRLINNLAKKLEKLLYSLDISTWNFDQEAGFFDSSKFSQFVANPKNSLIFKLEKENLEKNTVVSLLLDNSGSMRGKPIVTSAMTAEIITKTLEKCRVNVEILGFTTKEWKGGMSKKEWQIQKAPPNPGRLNDLLHIVYKDADISWNQAKLNLGLVLKDGLLKENIDGEALLWASERLKKRSEKKKILIVISDGAPVDDATLSSNNSNILDNHLKDVVSEIEKKNEINLIAIGIGHDVSKYYKKAFTIDDVEKLGEIIVDNLSEILKKKPANF